MLEVSVQALLRRMETSVATVAAAASVGAPRAEVGGLERAVKRVTQLAEKTHAGRRPAHEAAYDPYVKGVRDVDASGWRDLSVRGSGHSPEAVDDWSVLDIAGELAEQRALDDALRDAGAEYKTALSASGLPPATVALLESWLDLQVVTRLVQLQGDLQGDVRAVPSPTALVRALATAAAPTGSAVPVSGSLPSVDAPLSAIELGQLLHVSDQTVRGRERAGELFSILRPGRRRGVEYPGFQAWPEISGAPLAKTLAALAPPEGGRVSGTLAYGFFTARSELLGGLTPLEVLTGRLLTRRDLDADVQALLGAGAPPRLAAVERAARTTAAVDAA
jgi:hypothetical protein